MLDRIKDFKVDKYVKLVPKKRKKFFVILHSAFTSDFNFILEDTCKTSSHPFEEMKNLRNIIENDDLSDYSDHIFSEKLYSRAVDLASAYLFIFCQYDFPLLINDFRKRFNNLTYTEFQSIPVVQRRVRIKQQIFNNLFSIYEQPYRNYWEEINTNSNSHPANEAKLEHITQAYKEILNKHEINEADLGESVVDIYKKYYNSKDPLRDYYLFGLSYVIKQTHASNLEGSLNHKLDQSLTPEDIIYNVYAFRIFHQDKDFQYLPELSPINEYISFENWDNLLKNLILLFLQSDILDELENTFRYSNIFESHISASTPKELAEDYSLNIMFNKSKIPFHILSRYLRSICIPSETAKRNDFIDEQGLFKPGSISAALKKLQEEEKLFGPGPI